MAEIKNAFLEVLNQYPKARTQPFAKHPLGDLIRHQIPDLLYSKCPLDKKKYQVEGSIGQGNWAEVPWVCIFDRDITTSAKKGYYCVYLFNATSEGLYLSLAIGWMQFEENYGGAEGQKYIRQAAFNSRAFFDDELERLRCGPIKLSSHGALGRGYELGHILNYFYHKDRVPEDTQLIEDLHYMLQCYDKLKKQLGKQDIVQLLEQAHKKNLLESDAKDATFQKEIEIVPVKLLSPGPILRSKPQKGSDFIRWVRDPGIARGVCEEKKYQCEVAKEHATFISRVTNRPYVEAHHFVPMGYQDEFEVSLDVPENILILCPLCHRQFHHASEKHRNLLIEHFYQSRKAGLEQRGIKTPLDRLKEYYD